MNIIKFEVSANIKSLIYWLLGLSLIVLLSFSKVDISNPESLDLINQLLSDMPLSMQYLMGYNTKLDLSRFSDYYILIYPYVMLMLAIYASTMGVNSVVSEELEHTASFLYTKPKRRRRILAYKLLAGVMLNLILAVSFFIILCMIYFFRNTGNVDVSILADIFIIILLQTITQIVFYFIGFAIGGNANIQKSPQLALVVVMFMFMLAKFIDLTQWHYLSVLSIFSLLDPLKLIYIRQISLVYLFMMLIVLSRAMYLSFIKFESKDLSD